MHRVTQHALITPISRICIVGLVDIDRYVCSIKHSSTFHDGIMHRIHHNGLTIILIEMRQIRFYYSVGEL